MLKFVLGTLLGAGLAFGYVHYDVTGYSILGLADRLKGNVVATAVEGPLYDLDSDAATRARALEIYFANRAAEAAALDAQLGHPFVHALHRARATREARLLSQQWSAFDTALAKPALRQALETKHGVRETQALKRAMLFEALDRYPFLKATLARSTPAVDATTLRDRLDELRRSPSG